jgi:hypothetical protein
MCVNVKAAAGDMGVWKWVTNLALALHLIIFIATPALVCVAETDSVAYNFDQNDRKKSCPSPSTPDKSLTDDNNCFFVDVCIHRKS